MIDISELRKVIADCYWPTSPVAINEILDRLEAAEKERDAIARQLVRSEVSKRDISKAHEVATRRLSSLAGENIALQAKIAEMGR